jgi:hypothetical protein
VKWEPETADPKVGSFMPGLRWAVEHTTGPILELGAGYFSTPYLWGTLRPVVTYEHDSEWATLIEENVPGLFATLVTEFEDVPVQNWAVVLVDGYGWDRARLFEQLKPRTTVFVVHDTQDPWVPENAMVSFAYRFDFDEDPRTTVVSNVRPVVW